MVKALYKVKQVLREQSENYCKLFDHTCGTYVKGSTGGDKKCTAVCSYYVVIYNIRRWARYIPILNIKTLEGGEYIIGVRMECKCKCVVPTDIGKPYDFLGLVNNIFGGLKGGKNWAERMKDLADFIEWLKENT